MKIYISGVGVGLGPIAFMARDMGHEVICSDVVESDLVQYLRNSGFTVQIGQSGSEIKAEQQIAPIDWYIYSAALKDDNQELKTARSLDIKTSKRDMFINYLLEDKNLKMIAVAGTHGKTNTTAMLAWSLKQANIPISYSIGARISFGDFGKYDPKSNFFIYEADEYDRNFLKYNPAISIITNISFDHRDTYLDQIDYDQAFAQFIADSGTTYIYNDAFNGTNDAVHVIEKDDNESSTNLVGKYIRQNARLVLEMLYTEFNIDYQLGVKYINTFPGTSRRMEKISNNLYSDYAHHPEEIKSTIEMGLELSKKVVAVYQPHQNLRQHEILESYTDSFEGVEKIYWLPTYLSRETDGSDILSPQQLSSGLTNKELVEIAKMSPELASTIQKHLNEGSLVIAMAAGDLDHWIRQNFAR